MNARHLSPLILLAALAAGVVAFRFGLDPCLASMAVALVCIGVLSALVMRNAREKLAANRASLMRHAQMCPACGYTIRVDTDRCPECGTPVVRPEKFADESEAR